MPKQLTCSECSKTYSRCDHLNEHLRKGHNIVPTQRHRRFQCPFSCGKESCHTMTQLLVHCEKEHKENLGKYIDFTFTYTQGRQGDCSIHLWRFPSQNMLPSRRQ